MRHCLPLCLLATLLFTGSAAPVLAQSTDEKVEAAKQAAQVWIQLIDAGDYEASWSEAAELAKAQVTAAQWAQQVRQAHSTLDSLQGRSLVAARHTTSLPNAPEGEYVIMQYRATYGTESFIETLTMLKEDEAWRAAGYFIQPENQ